MSAVNASQAETIALASAVSASAHDHVGRPKARTVIANPRPAEATSSSMKMNNEFSPPHPRPTVRTLETWVASDPDRLVAIDEPEVQRVRQA